MTSARDKLIGEQGTSYIGVFRTNNVGLDTHS